MAKINILFVDSSNTIINIININKPKTYQILLKLLKLSDNYKIYYINEKNKEILINKDEEYQKAKYLLILHKCEKLSDSLFFFNYKLPELKLEILEEKYSCTICKDRIRDEKPCFCYTCQKLCHFECLKEWSESLDDRKLLCPTCREELDLEDWKKKLDYNIDLSLLNELNETIQEYQRYKGDILNLLVIIFNNFMKINNLFYEKNEKILNKDYFLKPINGISDIIKKEFKLIINKIKDLLCINYDPVSDSEEENESQLNSNQINIIYKKDKKKEIRLFGEVFVKNNKDKCKMIINKKEYDIKEKYKINEDELKIKLIGINNITDISCIFSECENLYSLPDIHEIDTKNINNMSFMFYKCSNLVELPDISCWNTSNVINMSGMFSGCRRLKSLPNISKWNINKVKYLGGSYKNLSSLEPLTDLEIEQFKENHIKYIHDGGMFFGCSSIKILPDISKWNIDNITNIESMFSYCSSLKFFPDISNWNTDNITSLKDLFSFCSSLEVLPDISNWKTNNVTNMENMFSTCSSLIYLPDISKWNTNKVINMDSMFSFCSSLKILPDISGWNTNNVTKMSFMFNYCSSLKLLPDISKWDTSNVTNMESMFSFCVKLKSLPNISKWNIEKVINKKFMFYSCSKKLNIPNNFT